MTVAYDKLFRLMKSHHVTSSSLMRQAKISGNIISRLHRNEYVSLSTIESICRVFQCRVDDVLDFKFPRAPVVTQSPESLPRTADIWNRRYLGNKFKLLKFLRGIVDENCSGVETVADIFSGTGAVASAFTDKTVITNDLLYSNYLCNLAWFGSEKVRLPLLENLIAEHNRADDLPANYMTDNFADTYFSKRDCTKIGFVREDVEEKYRLGVINERERAIIVASLIYAMDKIANTCGHYDAWRHGATFERRLILPVLNVPAENNRQNCCFNEDSNELVRRIEADLIYIDPPYNSRQYSDTYHLLENVARWQKPPVHGVARKMNRAGLKSLYCTSKATDAFEDLIQHCDAKYILFSYNNMANKGNARSNARIADEDLFRILNAKGDVEVFAKKYKPFTTGKSDIRGNEERLFLCKVRRRN
ncbi:MAG: DNA adenine methylase [Selenomonadaceae bacterium]|nr:DNA adenine methylase [Selenomonadaceae bacterium]